MKAVVKSEIGYDNFIYTDIEKPFIADNEVLVKIVSSGVCGSDIHIFKGEVQTEIPVVPGHEFCGEIVECGRNITDFKAGDMVISELSFGACMKCYYCKRGMFHMCPSKKSPGVHRNGAYAQYIAIPELLLHKIPEGVSADVAALTEPAAIVVHSVIEKTKMEQEAVVAIFGAGPIGLISVQIAKIYGASKVILVGTNADSGIRFDLAKKFGADLIVNSSKEDTVNAILAFNQGKPIDLVVECSGAESAINAGLQVLKKEGKMCAIGVPDKKMIAIDWQSTVIKAQEIIFCYSSSSTSWDIVLSLLQRNAIDLESLITHVRPLKEWRELYEGIKDGSVVKAILKPWEL